MILCIGWLFLICAVPHLCSVSPSPCINPSRFDILMVLFHFLSWCHVWSIDILDHDLLLISLLGILFHGTAITPTNMGIPTCSICSVCSTFRSPGLLCGSCKSIDYCSRKCQRLDWPIHQILCDEFSSLGQRPSDSHKLVFNFPVDEKVPRLEWLFCPKHRPPKNMEDIYELPCPEKLLGVSSLSDVGHITIVPDNSKTGDEHELIVFQPKDCMKLNTDAPLNQAILSSTEGASSLRYGPFVVLRRDGPNLSSPLWDVDLTDFRDMIQFAKGRGDYTKAEHEFFKLVKGVQLSCMRLSKSSDRGKARPITLPLYHPIFKMNPADATKRIGKPLILHKLSRAASKDSSHFESVENPLFTALNLDCRPDSKTWGWTIPEWPKHPGTILVVRQDHCDLLPVEVLEVASFLSSTSRLTRMPGFQFGYEERKSMAGLFLTKDSFERLKSNCDWVSGLSDYLV